MALTDVELAKLKRTALDLMGQDRQKLLVRFPFTGGILIRLELVPVRDLRLNTAATDGSRIFFDISFMSKLNADERLFVMAHEAWHCVLMHMLRCQTRNQKKFNVATDMEINRMLKKEGLVVPSWVLMPKPEWPDGLSAEEMYELLPDQKSDPQSGGSGSSQSGGSEGQFDKHVYPGDGEGEGKFKDQWGEKGIDPDFKVGFPKDLAEKIREKIVAVAQQMQRTRGDIPAHLESVVRAAGHGGTDFRPPFEYVAEHPDIEPSYLIYITDGYGPAPERPPRYPVLWLLTRDGEIPAPWGWKLRFKPMGRNE